MPKLGSAYIDVRADRKNLGPDLDKAKAEVESGAVGLQASIGKISFAALTASAVAFGATVTAALAQGIRAASDLEEATSKFNVVFKGQEKAAESWANTLVEAYGLSSRESRQYLSSVQDLLVPMGMQAQSAAKLSNEIVKLSVDLGSFNNLPTEQVMLDIQSALVGNYETMKKYGVVINAAAVQQEALNAGLARSKNEIDAADKAQAAYNMIVNSSTAAVGDFSRTSDGYANTTRRLGSAWEDFTATLAKATGIFDAATSAIHRATDAVKALTRFIDGPTDLQLVEEQIQRIEKAFSNNPGWQGVVADQLRNKLIELRLEAERLGSTMIPGAERGLIESAAADGYDDTGAPSESGGGSGGYDTHALAIAEENLKAITEFNNQEIKLEEEKLAAIRELEYESWQASYDSKVALLNESTGLMNDEIAAERKKMEIQKSIQMQAVNNIGKALQLAGMLNKDAFEAYKAFQIGQTIISTASAAMKSYDAMASIPYIGPALGAAAAAAAIIAGAAQIAVINSSSYSGGGSVGGGVSSPGGSVGTYQANPTTGVYEPQDSDRKTLTININGPVLEPEEFARAMVEQIDNLDDYDVVINSSRQVA